ncbi:ATP synthase, subunit D [Arctopsyche grandis]|uniref:ATP synthase, subunit D n=1 Tax=Arctopsyche grandis TaxID=121162 RepID=UPI00406D9201
MARRVAQSSVQWSALAERVPPAQKTNFHLFKAKSDGYLRRVMSNPAELPKIDWSFYKNSVPVAGMVDNFQKQYEALKIPFPSDTQTSQIEAQASKLKVEIAEFIKNSNNAITKHEQELAILGAMLSYSDMTMEEYYEAHPENALSPTDPQSFWPHREEDNINHKREEAEEPAH